MNKDYKYLNAKTLVTPFEVEFLKGDIESMIIDNASNDLSKEVRKIIRNNYSCVKRVVSEGFLDVTEFTTSIVIMNPDALKEIKKDNARLEQENKQLKEEIAKYKELGLIDLLGLMNKAEKMQDFANDFAELCNEFTEAMED